MSFTRWTLITAIGFHMFSAALAQESRSGDPLFHSNELLEVRIVAPMKTLLAERPFEEELPGKLQYTSAADEAVEIDIKVRTRGRYRRQKQICRFPPIRLNFKTSQTKGTLFHKQDKLKLVTHCQKTARYEQVMIREYVAYRILNVVSDTSFRVRPLRITYVDSEGKRKDEVRHGFVIEHRTRMAKRLEKPSLDIPHTTISTLQPDYANLISMFHYLIGNTDFSPIVGSSGESCCHNHRLFGVENEPVWSIPYDFDQSGLVDAPYAGPNENFRLRNVRQRLYRGRCVNNDQIPATIAAYVAKREEILKVVEGVDVASSRTIKDMRGYVDEFYSVLDSERKIEREFIKKCI
jgi:hypothetical protein